MIAAIFVAISLLSLSLCRGAVPVPDILVAKGDRVVLIGFRNTTIAANTIESVLTEYAYIPVDGYLPESDGNVLHDAAVFRWNRKDFPSNEFDLEVIDVRSLELTKVVTRTNIVTIQLQYSHCYTVDAKSVAIVARKLVKTREETALAGYKQIPSLHRNKYSSEMRIYDGDRLLYKGSYTAESREPDIRMQIAISCSLKCETHSDIEPDEATLSGDLCVVSRFLSFKIGELHLRRIDKDNFQIANESRDTILQINDLSDQTNRGVPYYYRECPLPH